MAAPEPSPLEPARTNDIDDLKINESYIEEVTIARMTEEDVFQLSKDSLKFWSKTGFRIGLVMFVQGCNQAGYGVDWAVIGGINAYGSWHVYFDFGYDGAIYGTMNALMNIGNICGALFMTFADHIGRRGINFLGNAIVIVAAIMQGCAPNLGVFMVGRFLLGFGSAFMSSPQYLAEVAPAHLRGLLVGLFGACFQIGSVLMVGAMIGFTNLPEDSNWKWRIPLLLEALFPVIVCATIYFLTPESPRYLMMKGRVGEARKVIAMYHTNSDDTNSPLVNAVALQIEDSLENDKVVNRKWWNFGVFFTKAVRYRLLVLVLYSLFQQWNGGGIMSTFQVPAFHTVGITDESTLLGFSLGLTITYFVFTTVGSFLVDIVNRRTLIFAGLISFIILQTAATITGWQYTQTASKASAVLTIVWIFGFQVCSSLLIATMHNLYPVEILSLAIRAKGMGLYTLVQNIAGVIQSYAISLGFQQLGDNGYRMWAVYIAYNLFQLVASYFVFPETRGLSLEEVDHVFMTEGVKPVKMSLDIQKAKKEQVRLRKEEGGPAP